MFGQSLASADVPLQAEGVVVTDNRWTPRRTHSSRTAMGSGYRSRWQW